MLKYEVLSCPEDILIPLFLLSLLSLSFTRTTVEDISFYTMVSGSIERLDTGVLELGVTEAVQQHVHRHVIERRPITEKRLAFEHARPKLLREMAAEATGVFMYGT